MSKPKLVTNASLFAKRGDDWSKSRPNTAIVHNPTDADKEAAKALEEIRPKPEKKIRVRKMPDRWVNRIVSVEETKTVPTGPDLPAEEAFRKAFANREDPEFDQFFCKKAEPKPEYVDPPAQGLTDTAQIKALKELAEMRREMRPKHTVVTHNRVKPKAPQTLKAERIARERAHFLYIEYEDGRTKEPEKDGLKKAEQAFEFYRKRAKVVRVEIWSNKTGEIIKSWSRKSGK